jgi:hypothetical protein
MTTATKAKLILTGVYIMSIMILIVFIAIALVVIIGTFVLNKYIGLISISSFMVSAVVLGMYVNKVINKIQSLW